MNYLPYIAGGAVLAYATRNHRRVGRPVRGPGGGLRYLHLPLAPSRKGLPTPSANALNRVRPGLDQYLYSPVRSVDDLYEQLSHTRIPIYTPEAVAEKTRLVAGRIWKSLPASTP